MGFFTCAVIIVCALHTKAVCALTSREELEYSPYSCCIQESGLGHWICTVKCLADQPQPPVGFWDWECSDCGLSKTPLMMMVRCCPCSPAGFDNHSVHFGDWCGILLKSIQTWKLCFTRIWAEIQSKTCLTTSPKETQDGTFLSLCLLLLLSLFF